MDPCRLGGRRARARAENLADSLEASFGECDVHVMVRDAAALPDGAMPANGYSGNPEDDSAIATMDDTEGERTWVVQHFIEAAPGIYVMACSNTDSIDLQDGDVTLEESPVTAEQLKNELQENADNLPEANDEEGRAIGMDRPPSVSVSGALYIAHVSDWVQGITCAMKVDDSPAGVYRWDPDDYLNFKLVSLGGVVESDRTVTAIAEGDRFFVGVVK